MKLLEKLNIGSVHLGIERCQYPGIIEIGKFLLIAQYQNSMMLAQPEEEKRTLAHQKFKCALQNQLSHPFLDPEPFKFLDVQIEMQSTAIPVRITVIS